MNVLNFDAKISRLSRLRQEKKDMSGTIFLIGFMGSGKTTLGKKLAAKLGFGWTDLDQAIVAAETLPIKDIVTAKGENYFREIEAQMLRKIPLQQMVVSTGGGTPCFHDNMEWLLANGKVVYIDLPEEALSQRLMAAGTAERPLLKGLDEAGIRKFIHQKLTERLPYYLQASHFHKPLTEPLSKLISALQHD